MLTVSCLHTRVLRIQLLKTGSYFTALSTTLFRSPKTPAARCSKEGVEGSDTWTMEQTTVSWKRLQNADHVLFLLQALLLLWPLLFFHVLHALLGCKYNELCIYYQHDNTEQAILDIQATSAVDSIILTIQGHSNKLKYTTLKWNREFSWNVLNNFRHDLYVWNSRQNCCQLLSSTATLCLCYSHAIVCCGSEHSCPVYKALSPVVLSSTCRLDYRPSGHDCSDPHSSFSWLLHQFTQDCRGCLIINITGVTCWLDSCRGPSWLSWWWVMRLLMLPLYTEYITTVKPF